jgi:aldehyde dehydrogenase (NAD+)
MMQTLDGAYRDAPADMTAWLAGLDLQMTIAGAAARGKATRPVIDPCSETIIGHCPQADVQDLEAAVAAATAAFPGWAATSWAARRAALEEFAQALLTNQARLATIIACETGRPLRRAWSEVTFSADYIRLIARHDLAPESRDRPGQRAVLKYRPLGVVGAIVPWNGPVILAVAKIVNALLAGDTMVMRPSPFTPLSALYMGARRLQRHHRCRRHRRRHGGA